MIDTAQPATTARFESPGRKERTPLVTWSREYAVGDRRMDEQHRHLCDLLNGFDDAVRQGRDHQVVDDLLNDLLGYTQEHFADEEQLLESLGYAGLDHHRASHRELVQGLERFHFEFLKGERCLTEGRREFLRDWLISHILHDDVDFAAAGTLAASDTDR